MAALTPARMGIRAALREHQRIGTDLTRRVEVFDVIEDERIWLLFQRLRNLYGAYRRYGDAAGIIINSQHPLTLQRFTAAHEYGHHVLGHDMSADDETRIFRRSHDPREVAAQAFAGEFLMPLQLVNYTLRTMGFTGRYLPLTARQVYQLALELGVSYSAAVTQLVGQRKLTVAAGQRLRHESPLAIKTGLAGLRPADSWADVWLLDESQEGRRFSPRLRDEIHVVLAETPSTGYVWQLIDAAPSVLALIDDEFETSDGSDVIGAGGTHHVAFRVTHPGPSRIRLEETPAVATGKRGAGELRSYRQRDPTAHWGHRGRVEPGSEASGAGGRPGRVTTSAIAPEGADLRSLLPPVRDQGQRGTCVAFAVTAAHEVARAAGAAVSEDLSEEALFWGCKVIDGNWRPGTSFGSAAAALQSTGQPLEAIWPYDPRRREGTPYNPPSTPTADWHRSDLGTASVDLAPVRAALDTGLPVVLGLAVFDTLFMPSPTGRIAPPPAGSPARGRHAVLAVGHDADALLIRNSWGTTWALGGYGWLSNDYAERHVLEAWVIQPRVSGVPPTSGAHATGEVYASR